MARKGSAATPESSRTGGESSLLPEGKGPPGKARASNLLPLQHIIVTGGQVAASAVAAGRSPPTNKQVPASESQGLTLRSGEGHRLALSIDGELSRRQPDTSRGPRPWSAPARAQPFWTHFKSAEPRMLSQPRTPSKHFIFIQSRSEILTPTGVFLVPPLQHSLSF